MWDRWHRDGFPPSTSVSLTNFNATNCSTFINHPITWNYAVSILMSLSNNQLEEIYADGLDAPVSLRLWCTLADTYDRLPVTWIPMLVFPSCNYRIHISMYAPDLYSRDTLFKYQPGHQLSHLRFSCSLVSPGKCQDSISIRPHFPIHYSLITQHYMIRDTNSIKSKPHLFYIYLNKSTMI
jgi:hypothetical protein